MRGGGRCFLALCQRLQRVPDVLRPPQTQPRAGVGLWLCPAASCPAVRTQQIPRERPHAPGDLPPGCFQSPVPKSCGSSPSRQGAAKPSPAPPAAGDSYGPDPFSPLVFLAASLGGRAGARPCPGAALHEGQRGRKEEATAGVRPRDTLRGIPATLMRSGHPRGAAFWVASSTPPATHTSPCPPHLSPSSPCPKVWETSTNFKPCAPGWHWRRLVAAL